MANSEFGVRNAELKYKRQIPSMNPYEARE